MQINERKTVDLNGFLVSKCNKKAVKQCFELALSFPEKGSLIFVSGPSPCGKTSLLRKVSEIYQNIYGFVPIVTSFRFVIDDFIKSMKNKNENDFFQKYNSGKLLLIDDVQGILGFSATQEVFADIFTKLLDQGINIILFSEYNLNKFNELYSGLKNRHIDIKRVNMYKADFMLRKNLLNYVLDCENIKIPNKLFHYLVINKRIEVSSFNGCIAKINLMKKLEEKELSDKQIIKIFKAYER